MNDDVNDDQAGTPDDDVDLEVRALLADAAVTTPMPDEVTARLDAVVAGLVAERDAELGTRGEGATPTADVTDLSTARARRVRRPWLGAAAAAVVVVAAGVTLPGLLGDDDPTGVTAGEQVDAASSGAPTPSRPGEQSESGASTDDRDAGTLTLTRTGLEAEVEAHLAEQPAELSAPTAGGVEPEAARPESQEDRLPLRQGPKFRASDDAAARPAPCAWPGPGTQVAATLDGEPAILVTRRTAAGTVVRVVTCADGAAEVAERLLLERP